MLWCERCRFCIFGGVMGNTAQAITAEVRVRRRAKDGWYIYTCDQLPGLYVAHVDDRVAYHDIPRSIKALLKLRSNLECDVAHKVSYSDFIRVLEGNEAQETMEARTQDLIEDHGDQYFHFILQSARYVSR